MNDIVITPELKTFLNNNKQLIATEDWINIIVDGYYELMGNDLKALFSMLEKLHVENVKEVYTELLLTETIPDKLETLNYNYPNKIDHDLETFIKLALCTNDCNTVYGVEYIAKIMLDNQTKLGIAIDTDGSKYYQEWSFNYV